MALSLVSCSKAAPSRTLSISRPTMSTPAALTLLIKAAGEALDQLWLLRAEQDNGLLLPDYLDPGYECPLAGAVEAPEAALRGTLMQIGAQMRRVGLSTLARVILDLPVTPRRQAALLALAGSARWQSIPGKPGWRCREAANGQHHTLSAEHGAGAAHAPHAILALRQHLWIGQPGLAAPADSREGAADCLSLDLALRDVAFHLEQNGEEALSAAVLGLCGAEATALAPMPAPAQPAQVAA